MAVRARLSRPGALETPGPAGVARARWSRPGPLETPSPLKIPQPARAATLCPAVRFRPPPSSSPHARLALPSTPPRGHLPKPHTSRDSTLARLRALLSWQPPSLVLARTPLVYLDAARSAAKLGHPADVAQG